MTNKINIIGSGQTSMLVAIMLANRGYKVEIVDDKPLKQSHFALLRFKTKSIEEETGIKCEEVEIKKAIYYEGQIYNESNIKFDNLYSQKVTGKIQRRSIGNLGIGKRYIPPVDFFDQLRSKCILLGVQNHYNAELDLKNDMFQFNRTLFQNGEKCISTVPMPSTYKAVSDQEINFDFEKVHVVEFNIDNCNVHQTIYYPSNNNFQEPAYRISVVGNNIKCEISEQTIAMFKSQNFDAFFDELMENSKFSQLLESLKEQIFNSFGINISEEIMESMINECLTHGVDKIIKEQKYGKISPIDEQLRHSIIYNLTKQYGIYSLGRFACWRQIMLDDVVKDVKKIESLIKLENLSGYEAARSVASRLQ